MVFCKDDIITVLILISFLVWEMFLFVLSQSNCFPLAALLSVFSWGIPLSITVAAVALKKIGYDASDVSVGWCWIDIKQKDRVLWMLLAGKMWEILAYVTLPVFYILIRKHISRAVGIWGCLWVIYLIYTQLFTKLSNLLHMQLTK